MPLFMIVNYAAKDGVPTVGGGWCVATSLEQAKEVAAAECQRCYAVEQGYSGHQHGAIEIPMTEILAEAKAIRDRLDNPERPIPLAFKEVEELQSVSINEPEKPAASTEEDPEDPEGLTYEEYREYCRSGELPEGKKPPPECADDNAPRLRAADDQGLCG